MDPESWYREPGICGSCIAWRPTEARPGETVASGTCRLRGELTRVPATLAKCDLYKPRGAFVYQPRAEAGAPSRRRRAGAPRVLKRTESGALVPTSPVGRKAPPARERPPVPRDVDLGGSDRETVAALFREVLREDWPDAGRDLLPRFEGGTARFVNAEGQAGEIPVERFFGLLEQFRSSLERMEGEIRRKEALAPSAPELVKLIRAMQGTLTTFNVLYARRTDYFTGKM